LAGAILRRLALTPRADSAVFADVARFIDSLSRA
jgi:hypothetical protein